MATGLRNAPGAGELLADRAYVELRDRIVGLRIAPGTEDLLVGKGVALDLLRRHAEAQQVYEASLKVDPDNAAARLRISLACPHCALTSPR